MNERKGLPCGCIPGEFLCPEAERLWREGNLAYAHWATKNKVADKAGDPPPDELWHQYIDARLKYDEHFEKEERT